MRARARGLLKGPCHEVLQASCLIGGRNLRQPYGYTTELEAKTLEQEESPTGQRSWKPGKGRTRTRNFGSPYSDENQGESKWQRMVALTQ